MAGWEERPVANGGGTIKLIDQDDGYSFHRRIAELEGTVLHLDGELKSLKEKCRHGLYICEAKRLLHNFEENLALYIYPRGWMFGKFEIFPNLMRWLDARRGTPLGEVANAKWLSVKRYLPWTPQHEVVLQNLRNLLPDLDQPIERWRLMSLNDTERECINGLQVLSQHLTRLIENENDRS